MSEVRRVIKFISALKWIILVTRSQHWFSVSIKHRPKTRVYGILLYVIPTLAVFIHALKLAIKKHRFLNNNKDSSILHLPVFVYLLCDFSLISVSCP